MRFGFLVALAALLCASPAAAVCAHIATQGEGFAHSTTGSEGLYGSLRGCPDYYTWSDAFTRAGTDPQSDCVNEGPLSKCAWRDHWRPWTVFGNDSLLGNASAPSVIVSKQGVASLVQYSGATIDFIQAGRSAGPVVRSTGGTTDNDCYYTFINTSLTDYSLRACKNIGDCGVIEVLTDGAVDLPDLTADDALGISVDGGRDDNVVFTLYHFEAPKTAPASFANWAGSADTIITVCAAAGGCDKTWTTAPSAAKCVANGRHVGMADGSAGGAANLDDWQGGSIP